MGKHTAAGKRVKFGEVVRQVKDRVNPEVAGIGRYIAGEHMDTDDLRIRRWGGVGDGYLGPAFHMRFKPGQVLYGSRRTYLRKIAVADFCGVCANTTFVLEPSDPAKLLPELLPFVMQADAFHEHSRRESKGSVNPYVNFSDLAWYEFMLPPVREQRRMAALLACAEASVNAARDVLDAALLLLRSAIDDAVHAAFDAHRPVELNEYVDPDRPVTYGILKPGTGYPGGVPVVKVKDFPSGEILADDLLLTDPKLDHEYRRSRLRAGDLLISIRGTIGRLAFVPDALNGANITQDTARLSVRGDANPKFIRAVLESSALKSQIRRNTTGLAVQGINIGALRRLRLPSVPRGEQDGIAETIEALRSAVAAVDCRMRMTRALKAQLLREAWAS